ncbi:unnamed protein product [Jaminaea pallidilutea]
MTQVPSFGSFQPLEAQAIDQGTRLEGGDRHHRDSGRSHRRSDSHKRRDEGDHGRHGGVSDPVQRHGSDRRVGRRHETSSHRHSQYEEKRSSGRHPSKRQDTRADGQPSREPHARDPITDQSVLDGAAEERRVSSSRGSQAPPAYPTQVRDSLQGLDPNVGNFDRSGDALSARYGSLEQSKVPRYRRAGHGRILGLSSGLRIIKTREGESRSLQGLVVGPKSSHHDSRDLFVHLRDTRRSSSNVGKRVRPRLGERLLGDAEQNFVPLSRTAGVQIKLDGTSAEDARRSDDSDGLASSENSDEDDLRSGSLDQDVRSRLGQLDRQTHGQPEDITAWLQLADIQRDISGPEMEQDETKAGTDSHRHRRQGLAQVQLSILDKGKRAAPGNRQALELDLARLSLITEDGLMPREDVVKEWRKILDRFGRCDSNSTAENVGKAAAVWRSYLAWRTSDGAFAVDDIVDVYSDAFQSLNQDSTTTSQGALLKLQRSLCETLRSSGYPARAFAIQQAQLEYSTACPLALHTAPWQDQMLALERFWDSEVPRLGEEGASGWKHWIDGSVLCVSQSRDDVVQSNQTSLLPQKARSQDAIDRWVAHQRRLTARRSQPARTTDLEDLRVGEGEVDPYSVIFFSDVKPFLVRGADRNAVLDSALAYLGLDGALVSSAATSHSVSCLNYIWPDRLQLNDSIQQQSERAFDIIGGEAMEKQRTSLLSQPHRCPLQGGSAPASPCELLWPRLHGVGAFHDVVDTTACVIAKRILTSISDEQSTTEQLLRIKLTEKLEGAKAAAELNKSLLAASEDSWPLWRAYASLQRTQGKHKAARRVYTSCLQQAAGSLQDGLPSEIWIEWLELELEAGQHSVPTGVLQLAYRYDFSFVPDAASSALELPPSSWTSAELLQAKQRIRAAGIADENVAACAAWLECLNAAVDQQISAAIQTLESIIADQRSTPFTHRLYTAMLRIIAYHLSAPKPVYQPGRVRQALLAAVSAFPTDTSFLCQLAAHEARFKIEGVLKRTIDEVVLPSKPRTLVKGARLQSSDEESQPPVMPWLMAFYCELHINRDVINDQRVRSLLERAVDYSIETRRSNSLWRLYLGFELRLVLCSPEGRKLDSKDDETADGHSQQKEGKRRRQRAHRIVRRLEQRAKGIFYRAISHCPWDRELYLTAFEMPFRACFSSSELHQLARVMSDERGLRVYGRVEDLL